MAQIKGEDGPGYAFIRFEECFVDAVGKALPYGLHKDNPAYLKLLYIRGRKVWRVYAKYLRSEEGVLLWETPSLPKWIGKILQN